MSESEFEKWLEQVKITGGMYGCETPYVAYDEGARAARDWILEILRTSENLTGMDHWREAYLPAIEKEICK